MNIGITSAMTLLLPLMMTPGNIVVQPQYPSGSTGIDVGYPNCSVTLPKVDFGVVGVNGGTAYSLNPCLIRQAMSFPDIPYLYVNTGWNSKTSSSIPSNPKKCAPGDANCLAYNYGYNAGVHAYYAASSNWIRSNTWWLDVETMNTWSDDVVQNRNSLQGERDALVNHGVATVGVYSTSYQWQTITGGWKNGWPNWGATVVTSADEARTFCTDHQFTGGPSVLMQYRPKHSMVSQDIVC